MESPEQSWTCKWCGFKYESPIPIKAAGHKCPKRHNEFTPLSKTDDFEEGKPE